MRRLMKTHSVKKREPCDICGDVGFACSLSTCCICHISHEHIYCMKYHLDEVPKEWFCEACLSRNMKDNRGEAHLCKKGKRLCTQSDSPKIIDSTKTRNVSKFSRSPHNPAFSPPKKNYIKVVDTGKVKFLPTEDVVALTSGTNNVKASTLRSRLISQVGFYPILKRTPISVAEASKRSLQKESTSRSFGPPTPLMVGSAKKNTSLQQENSIKTPQDIPVKEKSNEPKFLDKPAVLGRPYEELISEKETLDATPPPPKKLRTSPTKTEAVYIAQNTSSPLLEAQDIPVKEKSNEPKFLDKSAVLGRSNEEYISEKEPLDATPPPPSPKKLRTSLAKTEAAYIAQNTSSPLLEANPNVLPKSKELPNHHAINPTWKGTFEIRDRFPHVRYYEYEGLRAHPPHQVCRKAYEFSKQMPIKLQFKVHPRCDVWPEIFHIDCPTVDDIALYFLPEDFNSSKEKYHFLMEFMEMEDLAMSTCLNDVELIIFTSRQLSMDSQRLNMKFFLWGVFRSSKRQLLSPSVTKETDQVVDMEIDMVEGKDIGRVAYRPILERNKVHFTLHNQKVEYPISSALCFKKLDSSKIGDGVSGSGNGEAGPSPNVVSNIHSDQPMKGNISPTSKIKREISTDLRAPPGFCRTVTSGVAHKGVMENPLEQVSNVGRNLERPPGFSKFLKLKETSDPSAAGDIKEKVVISQSSSKKENTSHSYHAKQVLKEPSLPSPKFIQNQESPELPFISQQVVNHGIPKNSMATDPTPSSEKGKFQSEHMQLKPILRKCQLEQYVKKEAVEETDSSRMVSVSRVYMKDEHHWKSNESLKQEVFDSDCDNQRGGKRTTKTLTL